MLKGGKGNAPDLGNGPSQEAAISPDVNPNKEMTPNEISIEDLRRKDLESKFKLVKDNNDNFEKDSIRSQAGIKEKKIELLKNFYSKLREIGVDPSNLEQLSAFLQDLEKTNPDLLVLIEGAMKSLDPMGDVGGRNIMNEANLEEGAMPEGTKPPTGPLPSSNIPEGPMPAGQIPAGQIPGGPVM